MTRKLRLAIEALDPKFTTKILTVLGIMGAAKAGIDYASEIIKTKGEKECNALWNDEKLYNICIEKYKLKKLNMENRILTSAISKCSQTKNVNECREKITTKINKNKLLIKRSQKNIQSYKRLPSLPRSKSKSSATLSLGDFSAGI